VMAEREVSHKEFLDDLKERTGYCKLKEEALDRTLWRTRFGRGYALVVRRLWTRLRLWTCRKTDYLMNEFIPPTYSIQFRRSSFKTITP